MTNLKPFRDYSEHDVVNLFSFAGSVPIEPGSLVKVVSNYKDANGEISKFADLSNVGGAISASFGTFGQVDIVQNYNDVPAPIGILLKGVRAVDENGTPLIFEPRMAAERNVVLPHQAVPILTRGVVLINNIDTSDIDGDGLDGGLPQAGDALYVGNNGRLATEGLVKVGICLSSIDSEGYCLVKLNIA